jgi:HicB family
MAADKTADAKPNLRVPKSLYKRLEQEADKTASAIKLNLRLPKPLHKRLKQQARRNNISLNTEIINQLTGYEAWVAERLHRLGRPYFDLALKHASLIAGEIAAKTVLQFFKDVAAPRTDTELDQRLRQLQAILDSGVAARKLPPAEFRRALEGLPPVEEPEQK